MPDEVPLDDRAVRFIFTYAGSSVALAERLEMDMRAPLSDPLDDWSGMSGFWYELRDAAQTVLWRRQGVHPVALTIEAPDDDGTLVQVAAPDPTGEFDLFVPLIDGAVTVTLVGTPPDGPVGAAAVEIGTFALQDAIV